MFRAMAILGLLVSWLTGCTRRPAEVLPEAPGVSVALQFPVLLAGQGRLVVKDDELSLTSTTVASGLNFPEFQLIDSGGVRYSIRKVTEFGRRSVFTDMGTTRFRVFLEMQREGQANLSKAKDLALAAVLEPDARQRIQASRSFGELIERCR